MPKSRQDRNSLVKNLIAHFVSEGLEIQYANFAKYEKPFVIKRHAPDVIAVDTSNRLAYLGKAKMCSELTEEITKQQFEDFSKTMMRAGKSGGVRLPFFIAVPNECTTKIQQTFKNFEIPLRENVHVLGF